MSQRKTERLVNLLICLLSTRRYLTVGQIRDLVPGYGGDGPDDEAFRRMFERDKEELRDLGVPLETGSNTVWDDEPGYRIAKRNYELPEISLEPDEAAALGLAARLWQSAGMAAAAGSALLKLKAAGIETDDATLRGLEPRVDASDPAFEPCLTAVREGRVVQFDYRGAQADSAASRTVEPWGVVSWRGRWYLVGHDRDRGAARAFRLSRITGGVRPGKKAGEVTVPEGVDLVASVAAFAGEQRDQVATVRVRSGAGYLLRREAATVEPAGDGWDLLSMRFGDPERFADLVADYGADVVVVDPPVAREAVVTRLRGALGAPA